LKRLTLLLALGAVAAGVGAGRALAASERQAVIEGVQDKALRLEIERALTEEKTPPANRVDARRRARAAADSATALLRSEGYYDYAVEPEIGEGERPTPIVHVSLGPRTVLGQAQVRFEGAPPSSVAAAAADGALKLQPGAPARAADILAAEGRVLAAVQGAGYADAKAVPREVVIDHADHTAQVALGVKAGGLVKLGAIRLGSKGRTRPGWLKRLAPWKPGDVYKPSLVAELERRLLDTRAYDSVTVGLAPADGPDGLRPVLVSVNDRARNTLGVEAGYSSTEGGDIDLKLSQYNRFGIGDILTYEARYGAIDSRLGVEWALPHFWSPGQTLTTDADFFQNVTNAYRETGVQILADLTQRYGRTTYITRGASVTASEVDDFQTGKIDIVTLRVLGAFALDRTDNPLDPHVGFKLDGRAEPTLITLDETLAYLKAQGQFSSYLSLDRAQDDVVAFRLHVGTILGGSIPQVPASDRYYAGGGGSVRGYAYQSVGPHYPDNVPVGGLSLVEGSVEYRRKLTSTLGGVLFADTGSVGEQVTPDFRHTLTAVGVGLRYNLGFAPLRADLAFPLEKANGASQQAFQVYLSIGQSF
jgi:translocation and assembly module TamA